MTDTATPERYPGSSDEAGDMYALLHPAPTAGRAIITLDQARLEQSILDAGDVDRETRALLFEIGFRAWSWVDDVDPFEESSLEDVSAMIAGTSPAEG